MLFHILFKVNVWYTMVYLFQTPWYFTMVSLFQNTMDYHDFMVFYHVHGVPCHGMGMVYLFQNTIGIGIDIVFTMEYDGIFS